MMRNHALAFVALFGVFALDWVNTCQAQSPGFINWQPIQLDFSPYQRANDRRLQMEAEMAREEGRRRAEEARNRIQQVKVYYTSSTNYPTSLSDGWYEVWATDNTRYCDKGKVLVRGNKITEYYLDDFYAIKVSLPTPIMAGKCMAQLGDQGTFFDLYFLEVIADPNRRTSPPLQPGTVSFWGEYRKPTEVYVDGQYAGTLDTFLSESPSCVGQGTLDVNLKPGTHQVRAEAGTKSWTCSVTVGANDCVVVQVTRR